MPPSPLVIHNKAALKFVQASTFKLLVLCCGCLVVVTVTAAIKNLTELRAVQHRINNGSAPFCYNAHSGTKQALMSGSWKSFVGENDAAIVYPFCLMTHELGNKLGNYFTEVGCAEQIGAHFIAVHPQWDLAGAHQMQPSQQNVTSSSSDHSNSGKYEKLAFLRELPTLILHKNPVTAQAGASLVKEKCHCTRYCWQDKSAPWVQSIPNIRIYLRNAITAYYMKVKFSETTIAPDTDITNAKTGQLLPLIPDVALQYRCGDNIAFSYLYGILPFFAFPSRIPSNAKYIYVLSDHPTRAAHSPYSSRCQVILKGLFDYLEGHFPNATIVVKRGGDVFLDYARLAFANVTICSASSYCLWPALANTKGTVYFPLSSLIAGADTMELAPQLATNFHWIDKPGIISNFKNVRPWNKIMDVLTGKMPMPT